MRRFKALAFFTLMATVAWAGNGWGGIFSNPHTKTRLSNLQCEYRTNPLGIDVPRPRLSWKMVSPQRGQKQTAYQLLVASDPKLLKSNRGDLFDSGKITSDQSLNIPYAGQTLVSFQPCFWKVRAWDKDGRPTPWSPPAQWSMGIMAPQDWRAQWIGHAQKIEGWESDQATPGIADFTGARWVWHPEGEPREKAPEGIRYFRGVLQLPPGAKIKSAQLQASCDDLLQNLYINGQSVTENNAYCEFRTVQQIDIKSYLKPGSNLLAAQCLNAGEGSAGLILRVIVTLENGQKLQFGTDGQWKTAKGEQPDWMKPEFNDSPWPAARVLGEVGIGPWGPLKQNDQGKWYQAYASPLFRKTFEIRKPVRSATAYVCGLGFFEFRLNGRKVGDHELDPVHSNYDQRVYYVTHDITKLLRSGQNAIGVMLGSGWYDVHEREAWDFDRAPWRDRAKLLAQIRILYRDGSEAWVVTDPTWRAATGPIIFDGIRNGETYDARRELKMMGWDRPGFDDSTWASATPASPPKGKLRAQMIEPVKVMQTLRPVAVTQPKPGVYVFDMGQNMVGRAQLRLSGPAGTRVRLLYGEKLAADGRVNQDAIRQYVFSGPFQEETYILCGRGKELWHSHFTYHGFRYVQVTGAPGKLNASDLVGQVMHTAFPSAGSFECSDPRVNAVQQCALWSYKGNFLGYPTDCPTREKAGWTGDAHLAAEQALYNFQNTAGYEKWLEDFRDDQDTTGRVHAIVPSSGWGDPELIDWSAAYILIPWYLYLYQGDAQVLESHYQPMKRLLDFYLKQYATTGSVHGLGDWLPAKTKTPAEFTSLAYLSVLADTLAQIARTLDKDNDAGQYLKLAQNVRNEINKRFDKGNGVYANGSQAAQSFALQYNLADPADRPAVLKRLEENLHAQNDHLDVGIHGAKILFSALSENGLHPLAFKAAMQKTYPGYGFWIASGATTFYETWAADYSSRNHIMFGDISRWFYQTLAGINPDPAHPGFKHIILRPRPLPGLTWVKAEHDSPYGKIVSRWQTRDGRFTWNVTVPPNTTATAYVPGGNPADLRVSGHPLANTQGVRLLGPREGSIILELDPGQYHFETDMASQ